MNTTKPEQTNQSIPSSLNSSWLKTFSIGFSIISFGITIAIIGYIVLTTKQNQPTNQQPISISPTITQPSPTAPSDETANWKAFAKSRYYTFKGPTQFTDHTDADYYNDPNFLEHLKYLTHNDVNTIFDIFVYKNMSLERQARVFSDYSPNATKEIVEVILDGQRGKKWQGKVGVAGTRLHTAILVEHNSLFFEFQIDGALNELDQILSTFQFTD